MFGRSSRKYWTRNAARGRRSHFGGTVKSMEEIEQLSNRILEHEKKEASIADQMLRLEWEKVDKKFKK